MAFDVKHDMNGTAADPLKQERATNATELKNRVFAACDGFPYETAVSVGIDLIVNAIRQSCTNAREAEAAYGRVVAHAKGLLLDEHYDKVSGKRKTIFAHSQNLDVPFIDMRSKSLRG